MIVVLSNATRRRLLAIAEDYGLVLPTPIESSCGSFVPLDDVHHTIRTLKPLAPKVSAVRELIHVLTEASQHLDPIIPCHEMSLEKQDMSLWLGGRE
jgi:hypothetical protein